jgi:adenylate cyclase
MAKILVVDDEADLEILIKQKFRQKIREGKYEFLFALNGRQALDLIKSQGDIDVVLSDINMPEMDGLTLLSKISELNSLLKSVIISAYGDMDNIRTAMNRGAFDFITKPVNFDDLDITITKTLHHVSQLRSTLQTLKENKILKMYVDETVLNFMGSVEFETSVLENETINATVAFIDICEFTKISENENPDKVVNLLNLYFDLMVKEIIKESGVVDKFMGDAVMAVFRGDYHLDRAIDACLAIRDVINKLPENFGGVGYRPEVSIGICSGEMISGNIGSHTLRRLDYTVIGDTVNIAARLQGAAGVGQILIIEQNFNHIKESFNCNPVGKMSLKNKKDQIMVYEVLN